MVYHVPYNPPYAHVQDIYYRGNYYKIHKKHLHKFIKPVSKLVGNLYQDYYPGTSEKRRMRIIKRLEKAQGSLFKLYDRDHRERRKSAKKVRQQDFRGDLNSDVQEIVVGTEIALPETTCDVEIDLDFPSDDSIK